MNTLALFGFLGTPEAILIGVVAVLVFGRRLPEVGKNLGKSLVEFKRGLKSAKSELHDVDEAVGDVKDAVRDAGEENAPNHTA